MVLYVVLVICSILVVTNALVSYQVQQRLNQYAANTWEGNGDSSPPAISTEYVRRTIQNKWIYIIGDSSCRMFASALIEAINGTLEDLRFGSYQYHHKGGCDTPEAEYDGHQNVGCLREYVKHGIRVTFSFQAYGHHANSVMGNLISPSQKPDIIIAEVGAWSLAYKNRDATPESIDYAAIESETRVFLNSLIRYAPGQIVWLGLPACHPMRKKAMMLNERIKRLVTEYQTFLPDVPVYYLNRQDSTTSVDNETQCLGFHAFQHLTGHHLRMFFYGLFGLQPS